ncbi:PP2C family protein-serine/threonine phosphatase [Herbidospora cretacea]|uniref:PP2C family protein-serine/threonine phosphatase n=1 Tax=Herbidospora cretacea TaxID=28444 RepID=UPI0009EE33F8|nr:PP2C family protein-serine/threonine phosphatase [Herbidospora cretacea]
MRFPRASLTMTGGAGGEQPPLTSIEESALVGAHTAADMVASMRDRLDRTEARLAEQRELTYLLRDAILPEPGADLMLPSARVAVRCVPMEDRPVGSHHRQVAGEPEQLFNVLGGDWWEASNLPDGRVLLAVGDVSGHGIPAIAHMAQLRHGLAALAMTGQGPGAMLGWLNTLTMTRLDDTTATAVVGLFDPKTLRFTWAGAGHPVPVLVRGGIARPMVAPPGVLLGAALKPAYGVAKVQLRPGDVLLMFSDGLIERRDRDIDEGQAQVLAAAGSLTVADLPTTVDAMLKTVGGPNPRDDTCLLAVGVLGA